MRGRLDYQLGILHSYRFMENHLTKKQKLVNPNPGVPMGFFQQGLVDSHPQYYPPGTGKEEYVGQARGQFSLLGGIPPPEIETKEKTNKMKIV